MIVPVKGASLEECPQVNLEDMLEQKKLHLWLTFDSIPEGWKHLPSMQYASDKELLFGPIISVTSSEDNKYKLELFGKASAILNLESE